MKLILLVLFLLFSNIIYSQHDTNQQGSLEIGFISYLINSQQNEDAIYHINQLPLNKYSSPGLIDSISYLKARAFYNIRQLDSSATWFLKVSNRSAYYKSALFFAASDYIFLNQRDEAVATLNKIPIDDSLAFQARNLQLAGLSLLDHNYKSYNNYSSKYGLAHYSFAEAESVLDDCNHAMNSYNKKSLFIAGSLSAIIPGLGKIYAGKTGEGISSFLLITFLGAITAENYLKAGPRNYKTLAFGGLCTIFYIGNIYGSVVSLKVARQEFYRKYDNTILLHIHLPLRAIYGK